MGSPRNGDVRIEVGESCRIKEEIVDGTGAGAAALEVESFEDICKELEVEVADPLVQNNLGGEQDDVLASCESCLAELEEGVAMLFGRDVELPHLPAFGGLESFDVKKEPWTGQNQGISEV